MNAGVGVGAAAGVGGEAALGLLASGHGQREGDVGPAPLVDQMMRRPQQVVHAILRGHHAEVGHEVPAPTPVTKSSQMAESGSSRNPKGMETSPAMSHLAE